MKSDRQLRDTSPSSTNNVPLPAGTTAPVREKPITAEPLDDIIKPAAVASPPEAAVTHPS